MTTLEEHAINIEEGLEFPHRIRRCFMTGKQCIFSSRQPIDSMAESRHVKKKEPKDYNVFVAMPFRDNLDTFYEWSLKRYLTESFGIKIPEKQIRRADEFRDIGYVMCEKICRRIQDADVIVADLSIENANVMYELGLSVGLGKKLLVVCNEIDAENRISPEFMESIGLKQNHVLKYPSVAYIDPKQYSATELMDHVPLEPCNATMKIVPLVVWTASKTVECPEENVDLPPLEADIDVDFRDALRAAVGVAFSDIDKIKDKPAELNEAWRILKYNKKIETLSKLKKDDEVELVHKDNNLESFENVHKAVNSAFICLIDLAGENSHSYFWLGYCHARGINAIPIYRNIHGDRVRPAGEMDRKSLEASRAQSGQHAIAFDIRALWYIQYEGKKIKRLSASLRSAFEELIAKDIPRLQRNVFWERLTRHPTVHIYTGAVHHDLLNREVVGDWDQRTVSELVRYLSSAEESVVPELERPIYSPTTIKQKLDEKDKNWKGSDSMKDYIKLVEKELQDKNCLIVASADVNPLTEIILANAYELSPLVQFNIPQKTQLNHAQKQKIVVALKGWKKKKPASQTKDNDTKPAQDESIPTFFSRNGKKEGVKEGHRGFLVEGNVIQREYKSQDQVDNEPFSLLAHLVVMKNPFSKVNKDTLIVLLNGVSGPATFALAETLTGGKSTHKAVDCEKLLSEFNRVWVKAEEEGRYHGKLFGVEGFIEVEIEPKEHSSEELEESSYEKAEESMVVSFETIEKITGKQAQHSKQMPAQPSELTVNDKFYDKREVVKWSLLSQKTDVGKHNDEIYSGNPRSFLFDAVN